MAMFFSNNDVFNKKRIDDLKAREEKETTNSRISFPKKNPNEILNFGSLCNTTRHFLIFTIETDIDSSFRED